MPKKRTFVVPKGFLPIAKVWGTRVNRTTKEREWKREQSRLLKEHR